MRRKEALFVVWSSAACLGLACAAGLRRTAAVPAAVPRNVVLLIADGCGFGQIAAADLYAGGAAGSSAYEKFPVRLAVSTYSLDTGGYDPDSAWIDFKYILRRPTDSAAAATAMATGVKTVNGAIGTDRGGHSVGNIVEAAERTGKSTGVVTSVPFSHATPAGFSMHSANRNEMARIAAGMIEKSAMEAVMGCGHPSFDGRSLPADSADAQQVGGDSLWTALKAGTAGADADRDGIADPWTFIDDRAAFQALGSGSAPKRVFGIARTRSTLEQNRQGDPAAPPFAVPFVETVPTLAEMAAAALNVVDDNPKGFFLMVEGGAVDWASHGNQTGRMIEEMTGFNTAVDTVLAWVKRNGGFEKNLVVVTADHETGYPSVPKADSLWAAAGIAARARLRAPESCGAGCVPAMAWNSHNHTNALVPFFASGPGAGRFSERAVLLDPVRGPYMDNTDIGKVLLLLINSAESCDKR
jgi:alkaline phosphatase